MWYAGGRAVVKYWYVWVKSVVCIVAVCVPFFKGANGQENSLASLEISATSDSENYKGMHYTVMRYGDGDCAKAPKKAKLFRKKYAKPEETFKTLEVNANEPYFFQVDYQEQRRLEERFCNYLVGFTPDADKQYKAIFAVSGQVSMCSIEIVDAESNEPIQAELVRPEMSCKKRNSKGNPNGVAEHRMLKRF